MVIGQSPPTTSGVVIIFGSESFGPASDFPILAGLVASAPQSESFSTGLTTIVEPAVVGGLAEAGLQPQAPALEVFSTALATVFDSQLDLEILPTNVTTSGITIMTFGLGIGQVPIPFIGPFVINFRIFPVPPEVSTLTPGD